VFRYSVVRSSATRINGPPQSAGISSSTLARCAGEGATYFRDIDCNPWRGGCGATKQKGCNNAAFWSCPTHMEAWRGAMNSVAYECSTELLEVVGREGFEP